MGGPGVDSEEIIRFELWVVSEDLLLVGSTGEPFENLLRGYAVTTDTRFAEPHRGIGGDPFKERFAAYRHGCVSADVALIPSLSPRRTL